MLEEPILIKKEKNKKRNLMNSQVFMILLTVIFLLGVTYAFFEFSKRSEQDILGVAGNIYMSISNENIDNEYKMYPMESVKGINDGIKYQFTVNGYNDSKDTIYYGIYVSKGEDIENKIRLKDSDIMMVLYETVNGEKRKVYGPGSVEEMDETLIYANSILGNMSETDNVSIDYELIFWVSEKVLISNTMNIEGRSIYTQEDFANSYFNLRVIVGGDFEEKNTINDEVTINAKTKSDNVTYITNLSYEETPIVNDDVIINFTMNKEPNKLVITNELTNDRDEFVPVKDGEVWTYQKEENDNGKYTYYIEYSDGMRSDIYHYNVRIDKEDPVFNLEAGGRLKVKDSVEEIEVTNTITNISDDVVTLKYAMIKKGEVVDRYQNITNFGTTYEIDEELTNGVYELHVLAIDESGKQHTDYVTYEVAYDIPVIYQINDVVGKVEVVKGESINYLSTLPNKGVGVTKFTQNNEDMQEVTNETVVTDDLESIYVNYTDTVSKLMHEHNGKNGLVAISTKGSKVIANDTFREYRYSGNGRYCTYTNDGTTYTLNVESYESTCPNACINTYTDGWKYIIHRTSDLFTATTTTCDIEVIANETIPIQGEVKNYITFNNELWRIIGVFEETTGEGEKEELIKIIKDTPISSTAYSGTTYTYNNTSMTLRYTGYNSPYSYFYWNYSNYFGQTNQNDWTKAALQYYLNDETGVNSYYNSIASDDQSKIETVVYGIGNGYWGYSASGIYNDERGTVVCDASIQENSYNYGCNVWNGNSATWTGKIGMMYASDYGYAADSKNWSRSVNSYYSLSGTGSQENWLRDEGHYVEWTISPSAVVPGHAIYLRLNGSIVSNTCALSSRSVAPVLYLKSSVQITGGDGSYQNAYQIQ